MANQADSDSTYKHSGADSSAPSPILPEDKAVRPDHPQDPPGQDKKEPGKPMTRPIEWVQLIVNISLVVIGVVAVSIYGSQLKVFKEQFGEMQRQTGILNGQAQQAATDSKDAAGKVERQLKILEDQAKAAKDSVNAANRAMRLSQRPWVGLDDDPKSDAFEGGPVAIMDEHAYMSYSIRAKNFGAFPAQEINAHGVVIVTDDYNVVLEEFRKGCPPGLTKKGFGSVLFPGTPYRSQTETTSIYPVKLRHPAGHGIGASFVGCISYRDPWGKLYKTRFIYALMNSGRSGLQIDPKSKLPFVGVWKYMYGDVE